MNLNINFETMFLGLERMGFISVILPFILIFTVVFAILNMVNIFGTNSKKFNVVIALVFGLLTIYGHYAGFQPDVVGIILTALPQVSLWLIIGLSFLLLIGIFGMTNDTFPFVYYFRKWLPWLAMLLIAYIFFGKALGLEMIIGPDFVSLALTLAVFGLIIWFITKEDDDADKKQAKKVKDLQNLKDLKDAYENLNPKKGDNLSK